MQVLISCLIASIVLIYSLYEYKWRNPMSSENLQISLSSQVAQNILDYASIAKQYSEIESAANLLIPNTTFANDFNYKFKPLGDYSAYIVSTDNNRYLAVSWNAFNLKVDNNSVNGVLANMVSQQRQPSGTNWFIPLVVANAGCSGKILNANLTPIYTHIDGYENLFKLLCNQATNLGGFGDYVLITKII